MTVRDILDNQKGLDICRWSGGKEAACRCRRLSLIPGSGKAIGVGNGNPLQYSCLETFMDRGAWPATIHGVAKSQVKRRTHIFTLKSMHMNLIHFCLLRNHCRDTASQAEHNSVRTACSFQALQDGTCRHLQKGEPLPGIYVQSSNMLTWGFLGSSDGKVFAYNVGDLGWRPGSGRFPWRRK